MLALEAAREKILSALPGPTAEIISLNEADGRVLAENISSPVDLPHFDNSAVDGYAVRAEDVRTASATAPSRLKVIGKVAAGENFTGRLNPNESVRLFTGSPLPAGADAVVMQEDTRLPAEDPASILITDAAAPWENVRLRGVDLKVGELVAETGTRLHAPLLGLLAAVGVEEVSVARQPTVSLLATGSELVEAGQPLAPGKIHESNRLMLAPLVRAAGAN
ncbi:MAG: molybdopterin molybdenumtransferase MoeA, partial [Verrucomicrobia bacterium]